MNEIGYFHFVSADSLLAKNSVVEHFGSGNHKLFKNFERKKTHWFDQ